MTQRKQILFKVDNITMVVETRDLELSEIEKTKELVAQECECSIEDVEVEIVEEEQAMSEDVDSTDIGLVFWRSLCFDPIVGVMNQIDEESDEFIDLMAAYQRHENLEAIAESLNFFVD